MKKLFSALLVITALVASVEVRAQGLGGGMYGPARRVVKVAALPATCDVGQIVFLTVAPIGVHQCSAPNTWTPAGIGTGGTITGPLEIIVPADSNGEYALYGETDAATGDSFTNMYGLFGSLAAANDAVVTTTRGLFSETFVSDTAAVTNAIAAYLSQADEQGTGVITNAYGLVVNRVVDAANNVQIYLDSDSAFDAPATGNYAIYSKNTDSSLFSGPILLPDGNVAGSVTSLGRSASSGQGLYLEANGVFWGQSGASFVRAGSDGVRVFNNGCYMFTSGEASGSQDIKICRDAANTLALRNSTNANTLRTYGTFTDSSNYQRSALTQNSLLYEAAGTGAASDFTVGTSTNAGLQLHTNGANRWTINGAGVLRPVLDNSYDLGASGNGIRNTYTGRIVTGDATPTVGTFSGYGSGATGSLETGSSDLAGVITVSTGTGAAAAGSLVLTFSTGNGAYGTNAPVCTAMLQDGGQSWPNTSQLRIGTISTTSVTIKFDGSVALTSSSSNAYKIAYHCIGK